MLKFNLETFPHHCKNCDWLVDNKPKITCPNALMVTRYLSKRCSITNCPEKDEWFEGFEKKQRDILEATWEWCEQNGLATDKTNVAILRAFIKKEILGVLK